MSQDSRRVADIIRRPECFLDAYQQSLFDPPSRRLRAIQWGLYTANRRLMRSLFRLRVEGQQHLPDRHPFILLPNHTSSLDPYALAAALPFSLLNGVCWTGRKDAVLRNRMRRFGNRVVRVIPMHRSLAALAVAAYALEHDQSVVWFAEGTRSLTGHLQRFRPGIGMLLRALPVPVIPVYLVGTHRCWPPTARLPRRFSRVTVRFGASIDPQSLPQGENPRLQADRIAVMLHDRLAELAI